MALITCPECGNKISDNSGVCVHCGYRFKICPTCKNVCAENTPVCGACGHDFINGYGNVQNVSETNRSGGSNAMIYDESKVPTAEEQEMYKDPFACFVKSAPKGKSMKLLKKVTNYEFMQKFTIIFVLPVFIFFVMFMIKKDNVVELYNIFHIISLIMAITGSFFAFVLCVMKIIFNIKVSEIFVRWLKEKEFDTKKVSDYAKEAPYRDPFVMNAVLTLSNSNNKTVDLLYIFAKLLEVIGELFTPFLFLNVMKPALLDIPVTDFAGRLAGIITVGSLGLIGFISAMIFDSVISGKFEKMIKVKDDRKK